MRTLVHINSQVCSEDFSPHQLPTTEVLTTNLIDFCDWKSINIAVLSCSAFNIKSVCLGIDINYIFRAGETPHKNFIKLSYTV